MPEQPKPGSGPGQPQPPSAQGSQSSYDAGHIPITEELDSAKWTLPPIIPVVIALVAIAIIVGIVAFVNRPTPSATGSIMKVISADQEGNVLVAVHLKFDNKTEKALIIRNISSELEANDGKKYKDTAAPASDLNTYFQAFPQLAEGKIDPLKEEQKVAANGSQAGMAVFSYPVGKPQFDARKSLSVKIDFYDRSPMVLKQ